MHDSQASQDTPQYTNHLIAETSPYLLQHAHNPVDWYPWNEAALAQAKEQHKPILLSVGYAACHWCHVMAHESFEDEATAAIMNEHFVNIKVDREERPDIDAIYMQAVQALTGQGGWPMTVFLTPDAEPFYGGTYFPPQPRYGMPSFSQLLLGIAEAWRTQHEDVLKNAATIREQLSSTTMLSTSTDSIQTATLDDATSGIQRSYDAQHGGFARAPKFPPPQTLEFLLRQYLRTSDASILEMVETTLDHMATGGIYDHLGGGFHRYSVDERWLVPHFEKMLYDNAQLARVYLHAWQVTHKPLYRRVVEETLDYLAREMTHPSGGFYSTEDADSEGHEGKFYVWTAAEVRGLLGEDAASFMALYDVTARGNWEGTNILNRPRALETVAQVLGIPAEQLRQTAERGRQKLFSERAKRIRPGLDDKVLVNWNGLALAAFAEAGRVLNRKDYIDVARRNAEFILDTLVVDGQLHHVWKDGQTKIDAFLDDYAYYAEGLLELYTTTWELRWFNTAKGWADVMLNHFWDSDSGGFFQTSDQHEALIIRPKSLLDEAVPSGNGIASLVLLRLAALLGTADYERQARAPIELVAAAFARYPTAAASTLCALDTLLATPQEVAIIGTPDHEDTTAMLRALYDQYLPHTSIAVASPDDAAAREAIPLLHDRPQRDNRSTAYVCRSFTCLAPTTSVDQLLHDIRQGQGAGG